MIVSYLALTVALSAPNLQDPLGQLSNSSRRERIEHVRAQYLAATEERRIAALAVFSGVRSAANPTGHSLGERELAMLPKVLDPLVDEALTVDQSLAQALELRVVPGAFESRVDGLGEAVTVHLARGSTALPAGDSVISLHWVGPDGSKTRARREVIPAHVLGTGHFEMFIRPPVSQPAEWALVCEVGLGEDAGWSRPLKVECVERLSARREALKSSPRVELDGWTPMRSLEELCLYGVRHPVLGASGLLELAEQGSYGALRAVRLPSGLEMQIPGDNETKGCLIIVGGSTYSPLELAAGASSSAWQSFAKSEQLRVIFIDLPLVAKEGKPSMMMRMMELQEERSDEKMHLVAFGDAAGFIPSMRLRHPELDLASVTLVSDSIRRGGRDPRLDVKTLLVECSGSSPLPEWSREEGFGSVVIREPFILAGPFVPELIRSWIREE